MFGHVSRFKSAWFPWWWNSYWLYIQLSGVYSALKCRHPFCIPNCTAIHAWFWSSIHAVVWHLHWQSLAAKKGSGSGQVVMDWFHCQGSCAALTPGEDQSCFQKQDECCFDAQLIPWVRNLAVMVGPELSNSGSTVSPEVTGFGLLGIPAHAVTTWFNKASSHSKS